MGPVAGFKPAAGAPSSRAEKGQHLFGAALGFLVPDEMPGALESNELRVGQLAVKPLAGLENRERVLGAPEDQGRRSDRGELAVPRRQILEVQRAVVVQRGAPPAA